jgi:hypothetical protein
MIEKPNDQYNLALPNSLATRIGGRVREQMFNLFMEHFDAKPHETVLDIGVTSDVLYDVSNYFERLYPFKNRIVAMGLDDASFLEAVYPGVKFVRANALDVPFADDSFDLVHSSAVLEHVGSFENQSKMVAECLRVARRGICLTTPNRWFPIEVHTQLPLVHWLPPRVCRAIFQQLGYNFFADENNLNLMSHAQLKKIVERMDGWKFQIMSTRVLGWTSNLILFAHTRRPIPT